MKTRLSELAAQITEKHITNLNAILSKKSPGTLIDGLESFVALLRNHKAASNDDVELYFHDYSRLIFKLESIDASKLNLDIVEHHKLAFANLKASFISKSHEDFKLNSQFAVFFCWGVQFCNYAIPLLKAQAEKRIADTLKEEKEEMVQEIHVINSVDQLVNDEDLVSFAKQANSDYYERTKAYGKLQGDDYMQAKQVQIDMLRLQADLIKRTN